MYEYDLEGVVVFFYCLLRVLSPIRVLIPRTVLVLMLVLGVLLLWVRRLTCAGAVLDVVEGEVVVVVQVRAEGFRALSLRISSQM